MYHEPRTTANGTPTYPGDRSPLTSLYSLESALHLELVRTGPSPALLRQIAAVEARLNAGGAR